LNWDFYGPHGFCNANQSTEGALHVLSMCSENIYDLKEQEQACQQEIFRYFKSAPFEEIVARSEAKV